jgi:hypothetical protein
MVESPQTLPQKSVGGRPKVADKDKKRNAVKVYFEDKSYRSLQRRSKRTGLPLSALVYQLAVNGTVKEPIPKEMSKAVRDLAGMSNNLNQIAHLAHIAGYLGAESEIKEIVTKIDDLLIKISES